MKKPEVPSSFPTEPGFSDKPEFSGRSIPVPQALKGQPVPTSALSNRGAMPPTRPAYHLGNPEYVDPYLFETGFYASPAEYEKATQNAAAHIQLRADVENAPVKRRPRQQGR